jgi:hypothetical protein
MRTLRPRVQRPLRAPNLPLSLRRLVLQLCEALPRPRHGLALCWRGGLHQLLPHRPPAGELSSSNSAMIGKRRRVASITATSSAALMSTACGRASPWSRKPELPVPPRGAAPSSRMPAIRSTRPAPATAPQSQRPFPVP